VSKRKGVSKQRAFLAAYVTTASVSKSAAAAGVDRSLHYRWLKDDGEYGKAFELAYQQAGDLLEDEAVRRAHDGIMEPVFYKGKPAGVIRVYSDGLMMFLLRGFKNDKYRDRVSAEVSGVGGGPIVLADARLAKLTDEELASLIAVAQKLEA
jgi:hypothetical protein